MDVQNLNSVSPFTTKDGSTIRELLNGGNSALQNQSLAVAELNPGSSTTPHYHPQTEEIYFILEGTGAMVISGEARAVGPGDAIAIPSGDVHQIVNDGEIPLRFLCCCAPAYQHADTVLMTD